MQLGVPVVDATTVEARKTDIETRRFINGVEALSAILSID
jgi:hypothetical protein